MTEVPTSLPAVTGRVPPSATVASDHAKLLVRATPTWLIDATSARRAELKNAGVALPDAYSQATPAQRKQLHECFNASFSAQTALDKTMSGLQDIEGFAEPLLVKALKDQFAVELNVRTTYVRLKKALKISVLKLELSTYEFMKIGLLQAALHNFEESECAEGAFHSTSDFVVQAASAGRFESVSVGLKVHEFLALCRSLDIGGQYQAYIKAFFEPGNGVLRQQFIAGQKAALRAAAEWALIQQDITGEEHAMLLSVVNGATSPRLAGNPVWFCDLSLLKLRMTGCVVFVVTRARYVDRYIVYIPHDPQHPLKHYSEEQMQTRFKRMLTMPDSPVAPDGGPTAYQRFFSRFVAYGDRPFYFGQFTKDAPQSSWLHKLAPYAPLAKNLVDTFNPLSAFTRLNRLPSIPQAPQVADDDPILNPTALAFKGQNLWSDNPSLWAYLYEQNREKSIADAASHAVPTQDVDARVRAQKLAFLLNAGMFGLTVVAGFVPGLGEIMLGLLGAQLLAEVAEGALEWSEGDRKTAKAHLVDVAENLAVIALTAGAGKGLSRLAAVKSEPFIEGLVPVKSPDAKVRLWKPDLAPYASDMLLPIDAKPNALGQYSVAGGHYIRIDGTLYKQTYDVVRKQWNIVHPRDTEAYQPVLEHNDAGAWRMSHERPLTWDRLKLLRRLGHVTDGFCDETLIQIGDVSGVQDDLLRSIHIDHLPVPAVLADTLEQFRLDREVGEVITQIRRGNELSASAECVAPLAVEMPRWPAGRVLEVFNGPEPWGESECYGAPISPADVRATIKITRSELRAGNLAERVLAGLSQSETTEMLGSEANWRGRTEEQVFNERLADHALSRQKALYDSLYRSSQPQASADAVFQRRFPSLSGRALDELLSTNAVGAPLDEAARTAMQQGRLNRSIAGLHRENLASVDSDRLALHSLEHLPGWPGDFRLEVRRDSPGGMLLDSVGSEHASLRKCLVKHGESFRVHDEHGNPLNSLPPHGRNFFQSIARLLPIGVEQGVDLQETLARYARSHRAEMASILRQRAPRSRPRLRLLNGRLGYELSGRGGSLFEEDNALIARVRDIYPNVSDTQAGLFIWTRLNNGESRQQIFHMLANRQRELDALRTSLEPWAAVSARRRQMTLSIIDTWRKGLYRTGEPTVVMDLRGEAGTPPLNIDFPFVRTLRISGEALLGEQAAAFLQHFAQVRRLELQVTQSTLEAVITQLANLPTMTELSIEGEQLRFSSAALERLNGMVQLERLSLAGDMDNLDVSAMTRLRALKVSGSLAAWPIGVLDLAHLESLNLSGTGLNSVPPALLTGHPRLWSGLMMDWSAFEPDAFVSIYEHLHNHPTHPMGAEQLVRAYCEGTLRQLSDGDAGLINRVMDEFRLRGVPASQRLARVNAERLELRQLSEALERWQAQPPQQPGARTDAIYRQRASERMLRCWREGLESRFTLADAPGTSSRRVALPTLDLSGNVLSDLPQLPSSGFGHVRSLNLSGTQVPLESLEEFLGRFTQVNELNLSHNNLDGLPAALVQLTDLRQLNLSHNLLEVTPTVQARLNRLTGLSSLLMRYTRVGTLDVSQLRALGTLDLSHSAIRSWPEGVFELPSLEYLDMSNSSITTIPTQALTGHERLMLNTRLRGCRLTASARADAQRLAQHLYQTDPLQLGASQMTGMGASLYLENPLGIPRALLAEGRTGGDPEYFPEHVAQNPDLLLSLPLPSAGTAGLSALTPAARLQRLDPSLDTAQAVARINELRNADVGALQIEQLLAGWEQQQREWIELLNAWIDMQSYREGGAWISPVNRRRVADRLLHSWRHTLRAPSQAPSSGADGLLDLSDLTVGDLPAVPSLFAHINELNLNGVSLTEQGSNTFLRAFTHVRTLRLEHNRLTALPQVLPQFQALTRLDAGRNELRNALEVQRLLPNRAALEWLDLRDNALETFDTTGLDSLETLNLAGNLLVEWPTGVLEAPRLQTLNLRDNQIEALPGEALESPHRTLMAGTDLSDNLLLEHEFEALRDYLNRTGNGLGFTADEIDRLIEGYHSDNEDGFTESNGPDEHPDIEPLQLQKDRWFTDVAADSEKHQVWDELSADEGSADFFFTLSQLRQTKDFNDEPRELAQRVWEVLEALYDNPQLRRDIFARATAILPNVTCGDGRILLFNELETSVHEFNTLAHVVPGQEGGALFRLAREMIRLEAVEAVAQADIQSRTRIDPAEIRLAYRIGLAQRLQLPRQPARMLYGALAQVTPARIDQAYATIIAEESTSAFLEKLVQRDYWMDYLKKKYAAQFSALAMEFEQRADALEARHSDMGADYLREYAELGEQQTVAQKALALRLSEQERSQLSE